MYPLLFAAPVLRALRQWQIMAITLGCLIALRVGVSRGIIGVRSGSEVLARLHHQPMVWPSGFGLRCRGTVHRIRGVICPSPPMRQTRKKILRGRSNCNRPPRFAPDRPDRVACSPTRRNLSTAWLPIAEPAASAEELMDQLATMLPEAHAGNVQLRTWQRRVKAWRAGRAKDMILGRLRKPTDMAADV